MTRHPRKETEQPNETPKSLLTARPLPGDPPLYSPLYGPASKSVCPRPSWVLAQHPPPSALWGFGFRHLGEAARVPRVPAMSQVPLSLLAAAQAFAAWEATLASLPLRT